MRKILRTRWRGIVCCFCARHTQNVEWVFFHLRFSRVKSINLSTLVERWKTFDILSVFTPKRNEEKKEGNAYSCTVHTEWNARNVSLAKFACATLTVHVEHIILCTSFIFVVEKKKLLGPSILFAVTSANQAEWHKEINAVNMSIDVDVDVL